VTPLAAFVCESCGEVVFPARALCPRCGESCWREEAFAGGVVEQTTEHRGVPIASVRADLGPVVIVRGRAPASSRVRLEADGGAPVTDP
jgi:uncharacterized OB-fold protein